MADEKNKKPAAEAKPENQEAAVETKPAPKKELPKFNIGDTLRVYVKIQESEDKFRLQPFEGICIRKRGTGASKSFTVRKISLTQSSPKHTWVETS